MVEAILALRGIDAQAVSEHPTESAQSAYIQYSQRDPHPLFLNLETPHSQWSEEYSDLPNRQLKVKIADRNIVETADAGESQKSFTPAPRCAIVGEGHAHALTPTTFDFSPLQSASAPRRQACRPPSTALFTQPSPGALLCGTCWARFAGLDRASFAPREPKHTYLSVFYLVYAVHQARKTLSVCTRKQRPR